MTFYRVVEDGATIATPSTQRQATLQAAHLEVKMFNVGKGEAVLIVFPNSNAWLIEVGCNSRPANAQLGNWVVQYLIDHQLTLEVGFNFDAHRVSFKRRFLSIGRERSLALRRFHGRQRTRAGWLR